MSIQEAAQAALAHFPDTPVETPSGVFSLPVVMVAIAGGESGWRPDAAGDRLWRPWNCDGYISWGLWQINMDAHKAKLGQLGAPIDAPCNTARWLQDPDNNARAARAVYDSQGLGAWTVWRRQIYVQYLLQARAAVDQAKPPPQGGSPGAPLITGSPPTGGYFAPLAEHAALVVLGVAAVGTGAVILWRSGALEAIRQRLFPEREIGMEIPD